MHPQSYNETLTDQDYENIEEGQLRKSTSPKRSNAGLSAAFRRGNTFGPPPKGTESSNKEIDREATLQSLLTNPLKTMVSKNKRRFLWEDYDLDLAYITDNIIAMGFPSENIEAIYRNSLDEVQSFLHARHPGHYKVYNLCSERKYSKEKFEGNVIEFPFEDHNAPPFELIFKCCEDMHIWLNKNEQNVLAIHCKAGKGRTGLIICCYLMYAGVYSTTEESLKFYGEMRTKDGKGVTIPSQRRYIKYFQQALKSNMSLEKYLSLKRKSKITKIKMTAAPQIHVFGGCTPWVSIYSHGEEFKSKYSHELVSYKTGEQFQIKINQPFSLKDDFRVTFYSKGQILNKSSEFMRIWLNLKFIQKDEVEVPAREIDGVKQDDSKFNINMKVFITFNHSLNE